MIKRLLIVFALGIASFTGIGQTYNMGNSSINTCGGTFYDSQGAGGNYLNNENYTMTFCSNTAGQCVRIVFTAFNLENNYDFLTIYNGPNTASPVVGSWTGGGLPAPITSTTGCLTFQFTSDITIRSGGWAATISCVPCGGGGCPTCSGGAPPANDACAGAQNLGLLPVPAGCPNGVGAWANWNTTNICATAEAPYTSLLGCQPAGNMASPASDVWYMFNITGPTLNVQINGMATPNVGLYSGNICSNLIPRGCAVGGGGSLNTSFTGLAAGTYYLQVSGGNLNDQCPFTLSLQNNYDCAGCVIQSSLTVNPPPVNGTYQAGQSVTFCYTVSNYNQTSVNWLHAVTPSFTAGWDMSTLTTVPAASCDGAGTWAWYNGTVTSTATGLVTGPGFFYESPLGSPFGVSDANPGNNFGDNNPANTCDWTFCWTISTNPPALCVQGQSLNVIIDTYGDGESGSWTSFACPGDPITTFFATLSCCVPPNLAIVQPLCNGQNGSATGTGQGVGPWDYIWRNNAGTIIQQVNNVNGNNLIINLAPGNYSLTTVDNNNCSAVTNFVVNAVPAINVAINAGAAKCGNNNGSITIIANGGTAPLQYSINNGVTYQAGNVFNGLAAGPYTVVVRDANGCTVSNVVNVAASPLPVIASTPVVAVTCNGGANGSITINANSGNPPFQYSINNGVTYQAGNAFAGLTAGNYNVVVQDADGCTVTAVVNVPQPPVINIANVVVDATCGNANGSITVNANGGTGVLQYSNNNGVSYQAGNVFAGLPAGNYDIVVRDANGCTATLTASISNVGAPAINSTPVVNVLCSGGNNGSITVNASGGTGVLTYSNNNGATFQAGNIFGGLAAGSYDIVVRDANGCQVTLNVVVTQPPSIVINPLSTGTTCGNANGSITINAAGGTGAYQYSITGGAPYQAGNIFNAVASGNYTLAVIDANGCTSTQAINIANTPGPTIASTPSVNVDCNGNANGSITINTNGGTGAIQYSINNGVTYSANNNFTNLAPGNYSIIIQDANLCTATTNVVITQPNPIVVNAVTVGTTCSASNGTITINAAGGTGALQYSVDGGATFQAGNVFNGLAAGNYSIVVQDVNGCQGNGNANIVDAPGPHVDNLVPVDVLCNGGNTGSITVAASAGTGAIQYSINNGATYQASNVFNNLTAGNYTIQIQDANGCTATSVVNIAEPTIVVINSTPSVNLVCNGVNTGSITVNASGGTGAIQYSINNGATYQAGNTFSNLAPGAYTVVVQDANGCTQTTVVNITQPTPVVINSTPTVNVDCNGANNGSITVNANGGTGVIQYSNNNGATYQVANTFSNLAPGAYTVVVQDANGCTVTTVVNITQPTLVVIASTPSVNVDCNRANNGSITVNANGGTGVIQYSIDNGATYQAGNTFNSLAPGAYTVVVQDANGCTATTVVNITQPTPVVINSTPSVNVDCNGANNGSITVNANGGTGVIQYSNDNGATYQAANTFNNLAPGAYTVVVQDANGCTATTVVNITQPTPVVINSAPSVNIDCNGANNGSITVNANGGTGVIQYSIDNGATYQAGNAFNNLAPGAYTVVVQDANGCTATTVVNITQPTLVVIASTPSVNVDCNGANNGSITINANGGTGVIQYSINNGATYQAANTFNNLAPGAYAVVVQDANGCTATTVVNITQPTLVVIASAPSVNVDCNGANNGSITVNANGGTGVIQYSINNGVTYQAANIFNGLAPGAYTVVVQDANGCTATTVVNITQPTPVVINSTLAVNVDCNGANNGSITINANGGTGVIQYSINNGATYQAANVFNGLAPGAYTVVVQDENGCTATTVVNITQPTPVVINSTPSINVDCNGANNGSITVNANGGTGVIQYSINNGATYQAANTFNNLAPGAYTVVVQDANGCTATTVVNITQPTPVVINSIPSVNVDCNGANNGSITVNANGGTGVIQYSIDNGATYQAANTFNSLAPGAYTVVVQDANGCTANTVVNITQPTLVVIASTPSVNVDCNGANNGSITVNANGGTGVIQYSINNGATYQAANTFNNLAPGAYTVVVQDANGCTATTVVNITQPTLVVIASAPSVNVDCNGANNGSITVNANGGTGVIQYSINNGATYQAANVFNGLAPGAYTVVVQDANGCTSTTVVNITQPTPVVINSTPSVNVDCNGANNGSITVNANGGTGVIQYSIDNGATYQAANTFNNLAPGAYTLVVQDANGCTATTVVNITQPTLVVIASTPSVNVDCNGANNGSITVNANGGTGVIQYSINNGATYQAANTFNNLAPGAYTIVVQDANGCTATTVVNITQPTLVVIASAPSVNVDCNGANNGSITVNANGGTGVIQYSINNGATYQAANTFNNLAPGAYSVVVQDANGCTATTVVNITQPTLVVIASTPSVNADCNGANNGSITVNANGGTGVIQYSINNGATYQAANIFNGLAPGAYTVVVQDANGCTSTTVVNITEPTAVAFNTVVVPAACGQSNGSVTVNANGGTGVLQYSSNNGATYQAGNIFNGLPSGAYAIVVQDANGCTATGNANINNLAAPSINSNPSVNVSCNAGSNGSITINGAGGTGALQFSIDGGTTFQAGNVFNNLPAGNYALVVQDANGCQATANLVITEPTPVVINSNPAVNVSCNGGNNGSITINANGGTGALQYSINNGTTYQAGNVFNNLTSGAYAIVVQDANGCTTTSNVNVTQPTVVQINSTPSVNVSCNAGTNGSITINANGGTGVIQYSINNGATYQAGNIFNGLTAGAYTIVVQDANGCTATTPVNITEPTPIVFNTNIFPAACGQSNGSITLNANGGTGALQYSSNNGTTYQASNVFNNLLAGNYTIVVQDANGCTATNVANVNNQAAPAISAVPVVDVTCNGGTNGSITINANGGTGALQYSINNGTTYQAGNVFNNLTAGNYTVVVQDANGCTATQLAAVVEPTALAVATNPVSSTCSAANGTINVNANGGTGVIQYSINNGVTYQASSTFNNLASGNYTITIQDANGCTATAPAVVVDQPAPAIASNPSVNSTCNGSANGSITINANGGTGALQYSIDNGATYQAANTFNNLAPGNYTLVVQDANGCTVTSAVQITEPAAIVVNTNQVASTCGNSDGSLTVNAVGGTGALQYSNNNGVTYQASNIFNNLLAGNYTVVVQDANGCTGTIAAIVPNQAAPAISAVNVVDINCFGANNGTITVNANGGTGAIQYSINNGVTYQATNNFTSLAPGNYQVVVQDANGCTATSNAVIVQPTQIVANANLVGTTCSHSNGSITIVANGGTGVLQYSNNNGATYQASNIFNGMAAGAYTIVVQDANGCTITLPANVIDAPSPAILNNPVVDVSCNGANDGTITINVNGGTGAIQYSINNGATYQATNNFTNLAPGNYTIVVQDANGCTATSAAVVTQPLPINANAVTANANCNQNDGSLTVNANGGSGVLQYSIDNGVSYQGSATFGFLAAGNYTIIVQDANGCTTTVNTIVNSNAAPVISGVVPVDITCNGSANGTITINANGGSGALQYSINNGLTYQAANNFTNLGPGFYSIVVQDVNGCTVTSNANIVNPPAIVPNVILVGTTCSQANGSITVNAVGGTGALQYSSNNGAIYQASNIFNAMAAGAYTVVVQDANGCTASLPANVIDAPAPTIVNVPVVNVDCNAAANGTITINANGGTGALQYSIDGGATNQASNIFSNLAPGNFSIVVTDANGCTVTSAAQITQPNAIVVNANTTNANCNQNDGSITVNANGGSGALQYSIDNGVSYQGSATFGFLAAGNYTIIVQDANGCTGTFATIINSNAAPAISGVVPVDITCNGAANGTITINANGGSGALQYSINNGLTYQAANNFTNLGPGFYSIVVQDANGCTVTSNANIVNPPAIVPNVVLVGTTCSQTNGSITVNAVGGTGALQYSNNNGATYQASNIFNTLAAGAYTVVVQDANGCTVTLPANVIDAPAPTIVNVPVVNVNCNAAANGTITINANGGTGALQYSINGGATNQASNIFSNLAPGNFNIVVTDANGCTVTSAAQITQPAAIVVNANTSNANCNQNDGSLTANAVGGTGVLQYSIDGGLSYQGSAIFNFLASGNYTVTVQDANGCTGTFATVINSNAAPAISAVAPVDITCNGANNGTITITAAGGTGALQYSINNGLTYQASNIFNSLAPGAYAIVVQDASGCTVTSNANIVEPAILVLNPAATPSTCGNPNGTINIVANGGTIPYQYSNNNGATFQAGGAFNNLASGNFQLVVSDANGCLMNANINVASQPSPIISNVALVDLSCNGSADGNISIAITGGTGAITYSINNGATSQASNVFPNLNAGAYIILVTDANGCTATQNAALVQPSAIALNAVPTDATCNTANGSLTLNAIGGSGTLQYSVDGGVSYQSGNIFNNLLAGNYTVVVQDANGCTTTLNAVVANTAVPVIAAIPLTNANCNGSTNGSIVINVAGGAGVLSYSINNGITFQPSNTFNNLPAGVYQIVVTDANGCSTDSTVTIIEPSAINVNANTIDASCGNADGSLTIVANGGVGALQYSINGGVTYSGITNYNLLAAGNYNIVVQDANGCTATYTASISNTNAPNIANVVQADVTCFGLSNGTITITANGGTGALQYSINNGVTYQASPNFTNLPAGNYSISVLDAAGCLATSNVAIVEPPQLLLNGVPADASCGIANGAMVINAIGGTGVLTYSNNNGVTYQPSSTFNNLAAGNYTLVVQDANGCTATTVSAIANQAGPAIALVTPTDVLCNGDANGSIVITANGGTGVIQYSIDNGATYQAGNIFNNLPIGNYSIIIQDANGCTSTSNAVIAQPAALVLNSVPAGSVCSQANGSVVLNAVGGTGVLQYSIDNGITYVAGNTFNNLLSGNYTLIVQDANGCTSTANAVVTDAPPPVISNAAPTDVTCFGLGNGASLITANGGTGALQYSINNGVSFQASNNFTSLVPGNYSVIVQDVNGCEDTVTFAIIQPSQINYTITPTSSACGNANGVIDITNVSGGTGVYQYSNDGGLTWQATSTFNNVAAGAYTVVVQDANGCTISNPVNVNNLAGPTISAINATDALCSGDANGTLTVNIAGGAGPFQYSIDNGVTYQGGNIFNGLAQGNYSIIVQDANGCTVTQPAAIAQPDPLVVNSIPVGSTCSYANGTLTLNGIGGTGVYQYSIDNGISFVAGNVFNNILAGNYNVVIQDANGCTTTAIAAVVDAPAPVIANAAPTDVTCFGLTNGQVAITANGGTGTLQYNINGGAFQPASSFSNLAIGNYQVIVQDANGCADTITVAIAQPTQINYTVTPNASTCGNANGVIDITNVSGGTGVYQYSNDGGLTWQATSTFSNVAAGNYSVVVQDVNGCSISNPVNVNNLAGPSISAINATDALCSGEANGTLTVNISGGAGPFQYSIDNGVTYQGGNIFNGLAQGNYSIIVQDANGCSVTQPAAINQPDPLVVNSIPVGSTCSYANGALTLNGIGGTGVYQYSIDNGVSFVAGNVFNNILAGNYNIVIQDANGCTTTAIAAVLDAPAPVIANASPTDVTCFGLTNGQVAITANGGTGTLQYNINGGTFQPASSFSNLAIGNYQVIVQDANGCADTITVAIAQPTQINYTVNPNASTCGNANGVIDITNVTGGTGVYQFSNNGGLTWQATSTFNNVAAGAYTVVVQDVNGCTISNPVNVLNLDGPIFSTPVNTNVLCNGGNNGSITVNITGGSGPFTFSNNNGATFQGGNLFQNLPANTYNIIVVDDNGCQIDTVIDITQPAALVMNLASATATCGAANGNISINAVGGAGTYQYSINGGATYQPANNFANVAQGNYGVVVIDANGCTVSQPVTIISAPAPDLTLNAFTDATCFGLNNGTASVNVTGGTAPLQYSINSGTTFQSSPSFTSLLAGNYYIIVSDSNGCLDSVLVAITQPQAIVANATPVSTLCNGDANGSASVIAGGGTTPFTYLWSSGGITNDTLTNVAAGTYTVTITDDNGCTFSTSAIVTEPAALASIPQFTNVSCNAGTNGNASVQMSGGTQPYVYAWSPAGGSGATANNLIAGNYTVLVTDANGCTFSQPFTITQPTAMAVNPVMVPVSCNGGNNGSITVTANGGAGGYAYQWSVAGSSNVASNLAAGTYTVTITDANGCTFVQSNAVTQPTAIVLTPAATNILCNGQTNGTVGITPQGGTPPYTYLWTGGATSAIVNNLSQGTYTVTVTDNNGCTQLSQSVITEPTAIALSVSANPLICIGQQGTLTATAIGGVPPYVFKWNTGYIGVTLYVSPSVTTPYNVYVTDANGCNSPAQYAAVNVNPPLTTIISNPDTICEGEPVSLSANPSGGNGGPYTYTWSGLPATGNTITVSPIATTTYIVTINDGCTVLPASAQTTVKVNPLPVVDFIPLPAEGCVPLVVSFVNNTQFGSFYIWDFGDNTKDSTDAPSHTYLQTGSYTVTLFATSSEGCESQLVMPDAVNVYDHPEARFEASPTRTTILNPNIQFKDLSIGATHWDWDFGDSKGNSLKQHPFYTYADTGTYTITLIISNEQLCVDTTYGEVVIYGDFTLYIPNAFSPNNDGRNDEFSCYGVGYTNLEMMIFDRWGNKVYHHGGMNPHWNGFNANNGVKCQEGVYVYRLYAKSMFGEKLEYKGTVTLIR